MRETALLSKAHSTYLAAVIFELETLSQLER